MRPDLLGVATATVLAALAGCETKTTSIRPMETGPEVPTATADAATASDVSPDAATVESRDAAAAPPSPDAARDQRIRQRFGARCHLERTCGGLWGIDCDAAVDGPYYYVKPDSLEVVSRCGGYCMGGRCTNCPPREWKCAAY